MKLLITPSWLRRKIESEPEEAIEAGIEMTAMSENLATGKIVLISDAQLKWEDEKTARMKALLGDCDCACRWNDSYGWVPEAGCKVHDIYTPPVRPRGSEEF